MKPELRSLCSPDLELGNSPPDASRVHILVQAFVGPNGGPGEESFEFTVVTRLAVADLPVPRWGRSMLLVETFSWADVRTAVEKLLRHCDGETWADVGAKINRYLQWEFDDYQGT